ncbi:MAG: hypothetical protein GX596_03825 [Propionibacterium sp.]|nr:hypothetical protein [Propionibacterium sp.]
MQRCPWSFRRSAAAVVAVVALAACSPLGDDAPTSDLGSPTPAASPSLADEQQAAVVTVLEYFRVADELRSDPESDIDLLLDVADGERHAFHVEEIEGRRERGIVQVGEASYEILTIGAVEDVDGRTLVRISACSDSSAVDMIDVATGESVLTDEREFHVYWVLDVAEDGSLWKVVDGASEVRDPCGD